MRRRSAHVNVSQTNIHVEPSSIYISRSPSCSISRVRFAIQLGFLDRHRPFSNYSTHPSSSVIIVFGLFSSLSARSLRKEMAPRNRVRPWSNCMHGDASSTPWQAVKHIYAISSTPMQYLLLLKDFTMFHNHQLNLAIAKLKLGQHVHGQLSF